MGLFKHRSELDQFGDLTTSDSGIISSSHKRTRVNRWLKVMWLDIIFLLLVASYGLGIFIHKTPFSTRLFPVTYKGQIVYPELAYPQRKELLHAYWTTVVSAGVPLVVICLMQLVIRSFWDWNNAVLGLFFSMIGGSVFQVTLKMFIGGLRPHFLAVCKPDLSLSRGQGYGEIMYDRTVCTGDPAEIDDAMTSFPSGHAVGACAGFMYLTLYIYGRVKPFTNHKTHFWKLFVVMLPVELGTLLSASKCVDEWHNWYDVLAGAIIGTFFAWLSYRSMFAATWNHKFNHVPLIGDEDLEIGKAESAEELRHI